MFSRISIQDHFWLIVFGAFVLACPALALAETLRGRVVAIADGDTITVLDASHVQHKIRLSGIDAPEKAQAFGTRSKQHLANIVFRKDVTVEWKKRDRYGRTVGKILLEGWDVNLVQVQVGLAWHYKAYEREQSASDRIVYAQAEENARRARLGLWRDSEPIPPWNFRPIRRASR